jgi:cell division protease FtsH
VEREVIFAEDVERIFGKRPWVSRSEELLEAQMRADAERMAAERTKQLEAKAKEEEEKKENE